MRPLRQMWGQRQGEQSGGPRPPELGGHGGLRENKERQARRQTKGRQGGVKSGSWGAFGGPKETPRDLGGPTVYGGH